MPSRMNVVRKELNVARSMTLSIASTKDEVRIYDLCAELMLTDRSGLIRRVLWAEAKRVAKGDDPILMLQDADSPMGRKLAELRDLLDATGIMKKSKDGAA